MIGSHQENNSQPTMENKFDVFEFGAFNGEDRSRLAYSYPFHRQKSQNSFFLEKRKNKSNRSSKLITRKFPLAQSQLKRALSNPPNIVRSKTVSCDDVQDQNCEPRDRTFPSKNERVSENLKIPNESFGDGESLVHAFASTTIYSLRRKQLSIPQYDMVSQYIFRTHPKFTASEDITNQYRALKRANPISSFDSDDDESSKDENKSCQDFSSKKMKILWKDDTL